MTNILLLEDLPEIRAWLSSLVQQVFPDAHIAEAARVHDALGLVSAIKFDLALIDLGLPDGSGVDVVAALREQQAETQSVVVTIHDDDEHLFPALQAGAFGYILKEQARELIIEQLQRISQGEPPLSPSIARRVMAYFAAKSKPQPMSASSAAVPVVSLTERETEVLLRVAKGYTLPEIGVQLTLSRHTIADYVKQIYRKLNVSSRAEAALEAQRMGLPLTPSEAVAPARWPIIARMIGRLTGVIAEKSPPQVLMDVGGVGYELDVPMSSFYNLPAIGERCTLLTHFVVREDAQQLFGFASAEERSTFRLLVRISGVGPRTALAILSGLSVAELSGAVSRQESGRLVKVPGIGKKTAERLLLELKGKLAPDLGLPAATAASDAQADIVQALVALGYNEREAAQALKALPGDIGVSDGIKQALKSLNR